MRSQAFSALLAASRKTEEAWHAAALKRGNLDGIEMILPVSASAS
jgi:hypothetical protein